MPERDIVWSLQWPSCDKQPIVNIDQNRGSFLIVYFRGVGHSSGYLQHLTNRKSRCKKMPLLLNQPMTYGSSATCAWNGNGRLSSGSERIKPKIQT